MRVYSEQEVSQIIERAAERQAKTPVASAGLTLDDLERIGAEVGLDLAHLRAAAAEVDAAGGASQRRSRSAAHLYVERWAAGALTEEAWDDLVAELQNRFGKAGMSAFMPAGGMAGRVEQVGRNREWSHTDGLGVETRVLVSDRGDRVRLRLSQRVGIGTSATDGAVVGASLGWIPGGVMAAALSGAGPGLVVACVLVSMLLVGLATFAFDRRWRDRMHDRLDALGADLAAIVAAPTHGRASHAAVAERTPPLSLDSLGEAPEAEAVVRDRTDAGRAT